MRRKTVGLMPEEGSGITVAARSVTGEIENRAAICQTRRCRVFAATVFFGRATSGLLGRSSFGQRGKGAVKVETEGRESLVISTAGYTGRRSVLKTEKGPTIKVAAARLAQVRRYRAARSLTTGRGRLMLMAFWSKGLRAGGLHVCLIGRLKAGRASPRGRMGH